MFQNNLKSYQMKKNRILYSIVMFSLVFAFGCKDVITDQVEVAKLVKVEQVSNYQNADYLTFNGKVKEKSLTMLSFRVGGPLVKTNVNAGDYVNAGEIIAQIDKRDYKVQLDNAEAQFEQLKGEYERYKELFEKEKIPANTYEKVESGYKMAKAGYKNALNQLNDTELKAPISGYIHEKMVENFNTVGPGQPIVSIIDMSQLEIIIHVPETQVLDIKQHQKSYLSVKNANVYDIPVKLKSVNEKTGSDGLYEVRFVLENKDNYNIYPGMTAEVKVTSDDETDVIKISSNAVFMKDNATYVWVYNSGKQQIQKRKVTIASIKPEGRLKVIKGLQKGDFVVTAGVHSLIDGQKVKPISHASSTNIGGLL